MQHLSAIIDNTLKNQNGVQKASDLSHDTQPRPSAKSKAYLAKMLAKICALQKAYGKAPAELETLVEGFSWALAWYSMDEVRRAFQTYITSNSDIPAPADIIKLVKEARVYDNVTPAGIDQLRQYKARGIPLTPKQEQTLRQYDA